MRNASFLCGLSAAIMFGQPAFSLAQAPAQPAVILQNSVAGMPVAVNQEVRVLTATLPPSGKTPHHSHQFPVTIYVLEGELALDMAGQPGITAKAGEAMIELPGMNTVAYNPSAANPAKFVMFYVSVPETPFLTVSK
jgi:quercetin dioxygenase-like cupin family protein